MQTEKLKAYIIAGAPSPDIDFIRRTVEPDAFVLCADRGYAYALQAGVKPDIVIGDFDSSPVEPPDSGNVIRLPREKDYTDTVHCIDKAAQLGYDTIVLLAATGGRLDHTLGNLFALSFARDRGADAVILSPKEEVRLLCEGTHAFEGRDGLTFSLFAFGCEEAVLSIRGAQYPLCHDVLRSSVPIGVSNVFTGPRCEIGIDSGRVLMVINTVTV